MKAQIVKLKRRDNPENKNPAQVFSGESYKGIFSVPTPALRQYWENEKLGIEENPIPDSGNLYEEANSLTPILDYPVMVGGFSGLRTSRIRSYYVHNSDNDKLILPNGFDLEELEGLELDMDKMEDGDTLLLTMNSIYYLREYKEE